MTSRQSQKSASFSAGGFDAPQLTPGPAAARHLITLGLSVAFAMSVIAIGQFVVSSSPAALNLSPAYRSLPDGEVQSGFVCNLIALECVMAVSMRVDQLQDKYRPRTKPSFRFVDADERAADKLNDEAKSEATASMFTEPQQLALMNMSAIIRHQAIWHALRVNYEVPPFTFSTFVELRDMGLATKPEGRKFHILTAKADPIACDVADHLQRKHDIHQSYTTGRTGPLVTLRCTCNWGCSLRAGDKMHAKATFAMAGHLAKIKSDRETSLAPRSTGAG